MIAGTIMRSLISADSALHFTEGNLREDGGAESGEKCQSVDNLLCRFINCYLYSREYKKQKLRSSFNTEASYP